MNDFRSVIGCCFLISVATAVLPAQDRILRLTTDQNRQTLQVQSDIPGTLFFALGPMSVPPIRIGEIDLDVVPQYVLPMGKIGMGEMREFFIPRALTELHVEAVLVDDDFKLYDSNVVSLIDVFPDLITASFRAVLVSTDSIPPYYTLGASLTAPTSGYDFVVDGFQLDDMIMNVYLRLIEPAEGEMVLPVITPHEVAVELGSEVGRMVRVYMMRAPRDGIAPEVYRLMAELQVISDR